MRYAQPSRKRRVNFQSFPRHTLLAFHRKEVERTHIVQSVRKLYNDNPYILRHRDEKLAEVFRLLLFLRGKLYPFELGYTLNEL